MVQTGCGGMIKGKCTGDSNPDAWFPDVPQGAPTRKRLEPIGIETSRAIALCNACPVQEECLDQGMQSENLAFGIWGGMLAGERVIMTGKRFNKLSDEGRALISYRVLKPWIEVPV
jgi:hypothetical protein